MSNVQRSGSHHRVDRDASRAITPLDVEHLGPIDQPGPPARLAAGADAVETDDAIVQQPPTGFLGEFDGAAGDLDIARDSAVSISTQIYWQMAYQIDSGRLLPGSRLPAVRELGAALRVNPNTIRAVYRRLAEAGYVASRQGAGTRVLERPPQRRVQDLTGIVAEMLRRASQAGFTADEVASATFAAASERRRPGPRVRVLFTECTPADVSDGAGQVAAAFPDQIEVEGALLDEVAERLSRFHYDVIATSTFHGDETHDIVAGRAPMVAMLAAPAYVELVHEIATLPPGSRVGLVCASSRGVANMTETLTLVGAEGVELISATLASDQGIDLVDAEASIILLSREAVAAGMGARFERPERIREMAYQLDPSGLELLRRAIAGVASSRQVMRSR